jgi:undecaprenyl-diphosphatase
VVAVASFVAFVVLAGIVNGSGPLAFDERMTSFVKSLPISFDLWLRITDLGGAILIPIGVATVLALLFQHRLRTAAIVGLALLAASLWTQLVKVAVERARPAGAELLGVEGFSFPSGHTLNSTVTYGLLALLVSRTGWPAWVRGLLMAVLITLPVLVGLSRVAIGVHYPTDVVGGWLAGIAVVTGVASLTQADSW